MKYEKFSILEINWKQGDGWQQYTTLTSEKEFHLAVSIVKGADCPSAPRWLRRDQMEFRIVNPRLEVLLSESQTAKTRYNFYIEVDDELHFGTLEAADRTEARNKLVKHIEEIWGFEKGTTSIKCTVQSSWNYSSAELLSL